MTRADKVANFIKENNPRRKDIVKFIVCTLNGVSEKYFDENTRRFRGYYSVAFQQWNRNQKLHKDPITQKYSVTKYYERDGKLYQTPHEVKLERMTKIAERWKENYWEERRMNKEVKAVVRQLKEII